MGINAPVARQATRPVATATAPSKTASPIPGWLFPGRLFPGLAILGDLIPERLLSEGPPGLTANRPAYCGAPRRHRSAQHYLLGLSRLARPKVNALAKAHLGAGSTQSPHDPARRPQQHGTDVSLERGLHRRVQVKAYGEGRSRQTGHPVLAAQILTIGGEEQLAGVDQAKALAIAVMRRRDPLLAVVLGTFASNRRRTTAKGAIRPDLDGVGISHHQHGMRGARPRDPPPVRLGAAIRAAIDDDAFALVAKFEGQRAGVGVIVKSPRRRLT